MTTSPWSSLSLILVLAAHLAAQPAGRPTNSAVFGALGIAAYEDDDYETARYWLQAAVYDVRVLDRSDSPDPWATLYLARMHYFGDGVDRDISLACALYETAVQRNESLNQDSNSRAKFRRVLGGDPCQPAGGATSVEVKALRDGCFWPGLTRAQFAVSSGWLTIDRGGVVLQAGDQARSSRLTALNGCNTSLITPFAHVQIPGPTGAKPHDFVYVFGYEAVYEGDKIVRTLHWYVLELVDDQLRLRVNQSVERLRDLRSPSLTQHPELLDNVVIRHDVAAAITWSLPLWSLKGTIDEGK